MYIKEPSRCIAFESGNDNYEQPSGVTIIEPSNGAMTLQPWELIQQNRHAPDSESTIEANGTQYENPLTVDQILDSFSHALSYENGNMLIEELLDTVPGSREFEATRKKAKTEITLHHLWRMGLPSELSQFLDMDNSDTRALLTEEYAKIPESTRRDNSANSFKLRLNRVLSHIYEQHPKEEVQDLLDIWQEDLRIRQEIVGDGASSDKQSPVELQRDKFLQRYLNAESEMRHVALLIGNTLLGASQAEVKAFRHSLDSLAHDNSNAARISRLDTLRHFIDTEFI